MLARLTVVITLQYIEILNHVAYLKLVSCVSYISVQKRLLGLPWWSSGKESALQCRERGWVQLLVGELRPHMLWSN